MDVEISGAAAAAAAECDIGRRAEEAALSNACTFQGDIQNSPLPFNGPLPTS